MLQYQTEDSKTSIVLGTLRYEGCEQFELDMCVSATSTIRFTLKGKGEVHLSGYFNALCMIDSDDESGSDFESYDEEEGFPDFSGLWLCTHLCSPCFSDSSDDADFMSMTKSPSESISDDGDDVPMIEEVPESPKKGKKEAKKEVKKPEPKKPEPKQAAAKQTPQKEEAKKETPKKEQQQGTKRSKSLFRGLILIF